MILTLPLAEPEIEMLLIPVLLTFTLNVFCLGLQLFHLFLMALIFFRAELFFIVTLLLISPILVNLVKLFAASVALLTPDVSISTFFLTSFNLFTSLNAAVALTVCFLITVSAGQSSRQYDQNTS